MIRLQKRLWLYMLQSKKLYLRTCPPSEDSDQPAQMRSLIRIFTGCILDAMFIHAENEDSGLKCADAQVDLSLHWAYMSECTVLMLWFIVRNILISSAA